VIAEELGRGGLALTLLPNAGTADVVPVRDVAMDGAIVNSCSPVESNVEWLRRRRLPLVFVDQAGDDDFPTVNVADRAGCRAAAAHVLGLGHRRIAVLTAGPEIVEAPGEWYVVQERMRGWRDVLDPAGVVPVVRHVDETGDAALVAARELLTGRDRPTAVLCFSDALAAEVVDAAAEVGLRVPDDLSVVGFDDSPPARRTRPTLTTVRQDVVEKGRLAAAELVAAVRGRRAGDDPPVRHHLLATELVVRGSTAPPPGAHATNGTFVG
jgi:DNA-binding LacI/PurR family transcriptional regulator